jgi:UDP-2-acetamido-2,6-beta-L-arabino-hexul-4-ose reductase
LNRCGFVFHLAGVNRPRENGEYERGNVGSLAQVLSEIERKEKKPLVILASSIQAGMNHPYGRSKLKAEQILSEYSRRTAAPVCIFRLPGVFGKWCRPDYNSVVATFCHNSARDLPIVIADPDKELELVHIDDVVAAFLAVMDGDVKPGTDGFCHAGPVHRITVGRLARVVQEFQASRRYSLVPDFSDPLTRRLYSTYVSYLPTDRFAYPLARRDDSRGSLAEVLKSAPFGQIFISRTLPGAVRGNHYHDRKVEKFIVLEGEAVIRFRPVQGRDILEYPVSGRDFRVVDIPPGYTHSIENIGPTDLVVLFWACEPYDPSDADTFALDVGKRESA